MSDPLSIVTAEAFAAIREPGAEPLVGDRGSNVLPAGSLALVFGDGGAGKTTLLLDLAFHLAAGGPWLALDVPRRCRVAWVENEGPRGNFREKVDAKLKAWDGPSLNGHLLVLEDPWGLFTFANELHRRQLAQVITDHQIDVLIIARFRRSASRVAERRPRSVSSRDSSRKPARYSIVRCAQSSSITRTRAATLPGRGGRCPIRRCTSARRGTARRARSGRKHAGHRPFTARRGTCSGVTAKGSSSRTGPTSPKKASPPNCSPRCASTAATHGRRFASTSAATQPRRRRSVTACSRPASSSTRRLVRVSSSCG